MYRKVIAVALIAMLGGMTASADTIFDATPADNQAGLSASAGQTFQTGTLVSNELTYISIEGPQAGALADELYLTVYENNGSVSNWVPGAIVATSTNSAALDVNGETRYWLFAPGAVLANNSDYLFAFTDVGNNAQAARVGLKGASTPDDGTVISGDVIPFGGAFDIACVISTEEPPEILFPPTISSFISSDSVVTEGGSVTLSWVTDLADTLTLNPGAVDVTAVTSTVVVVNSTTTFDLIATNTDGSVTNSLTVTAVPPLEPGQIKTSYGTVNGPDDANQAGPMFGQGITINIGANTNDAAIPNPVALQQVSFQNSSSGSGAASNVVYLQVYDAFVTDGQSPTSTPTTIGNLIAVSTNTVDLGAAAALDQLIWLFDNDELDKATEYFYILSTTTTAATVLDWSNLATGAFELEVGNPYTGGDAIRANGDTTDWDMEFEVITSDVSPGAQVTDVTITGPVSGGTAMVISWTSEAGKPYGVQTNSNLIINGDWADWLTGLIGNGGTLSVTNTIGPDQTFYRVISE